MEYLLDLIGPPRIVDVKATAPEYDNYGGIASRISAGHGPRAARDRNGGGKIRMGKTKDGQGHQAWASPCTGAS